MSANLIEALSQEIEITRLRLEKLEGALEVLQEFGEGGTVVAITHEPKPIARRKRVHAAALGAEWTCPAGVNEDTWATWLKLRAESKAPETTNLYQAIIGELALLEQSGFAPETVITQTIQAGLMGLWKPAMGTLTANGERVI